jgi:hypothetical protein
MRRRWLHQGKAVVALEVLSDVKHVLNEDAVLDLNFDKTKILIKGISAADTHAVAQRMLKPISPSRTSVPCSLPRRLWLTATLALVFPSALMLLSSTLSRISVRQLWRTSTS